MIGRITHDPSRRCCSGWRGPGGRRPGPGPAEHTEPVHAPAAAEAHAPAAAGGHGESAGGHGGADAQPESLELQPSLAIWTVVVFLGLMARPGQVRLEAAARGPAQAGGPPGARAARHRAGPERDREPAGRAPPADGRRRRRGAGDVEKARQDAQAMADEMIKKAQGEAEASRQRAERDIATARDQALMEIWAKAADLAVVGRRPGARHGAEPRRAPPAGRGRHERAARRQRPTGRGARMSDAPTPTPTATAPGSAVEARSFDDERPRSPGATPRRCSMPPRRRARPTPSSTSCEEIVADVFGKSRGSPTCSARDRLPATRRTGCSSRSSSGRASDLVVRFLRVLNRHGRLDLLGDGGRRGAGRSGTAGRTAGRSRSARRSRSTTGSCRRCATGSRGLVAATPS